MGFLVNLTLNAWSGYTVVSSPIGSWLSTYYLSGTLKLGADFTSCGFTGLHGCSHMSGLILTGGLPVGALGSSCLSSFRIVRNELFNPFLSSWFLPILVRGILVICQPGIQSASASLSHSHGCWLAQMHPVVVPTAVDPNLCSLKLECLQLRRM